MDNFILPNDIMYILLGCIIALLLHWLYTLHNDKTTDIHLNDMITEKGKLNGSKLFRFVAFLISSWGFIYLIVTNNLSEWYGVSYLAVWTSNALLRNKFLPESNQMP